MCGLKSKLKLPDFEEFIQQYKLIFLTETKLDELDDITIPNYKIFTNNRKIKKRASGGVATLVHNSITDHVTVLDTDINSTMWIRLDKRLCQIPIVFGLVYNPPDNSPYADISIFDQIENTIIDIKFQNSKTGICLLGDLNARTGTLSDRIETTDTMYEDGTVMLDNDDASCTTSQNRRVRSNSDKAINQMGRRLIDMCRSLNLHILNGRYGGDHDIGKPTCKNSSTVDYIIISENLSKIISDFDILEFDRTLSDIHCQIYASFDSTPQISAQYKVKHYEPHKTTEKNKFKWNSNFIDIYRENQTNLKNDIEDSIHRAEIKGSPLEEDINEIANVISEALKKAAYNSGMGKSTQKTNVKKRQLPHKPWYDDCCEKSRKNMIKFRKQYRKDKNTDNLNLVNKSSTKYKKIVHKAYSEYKKKIISKLRLLQSENPKEYWKIIKGEKKSEVQHKISLDLFKEHFEKLALGNEGVNVSKTTGDPLNMPPDTMLNSPFTQQEIAEAIAKLKNNKAGGSDQIINEFLKHSRNEFV